MCEIWMYLSRMAEICPEGFVKMKETLHPKFWCRAFFKDESKCDSVDKNVCETFNGCIIEARSLPIVSMLEEIRLYVMKKMVEKRDASKKWKQPFAPRVAKELSLSKKKSYEWTLKYNVVDGYEVSCKDHMFVVYLGKCICTCRRWQLKGYPCVHGMTCILHEKRKVEDYIEHWYKMPTYLKAYSTMMEPVRSIRDWPITMDQTLPPPLDRRMPGRPKLNKRRLEEAERALREDSATHITRHGRRMVCTICNKPDHNKRTCPDKDKENQDNGPSEPQVSQVVGPSQPILTQQEQEPIANQKQQAPPMATTRAQQQQRAPTGFGVYTNPETGEQTINPGNMPATLRGRGRMVASEQGND